MNYQISLVGAMLQTGDPPMLQTVATTKRRSVTISTDQFVNLISLYSLNELPVADGNSSFD